MNIIARALDSPNYKGDIVDDFEPDNQALASVLKKFYRDLKFPVLQKVTPFFSYYSSPGNDETIKEKTFFFVMIKFLFLVLGLLKSFFGLITTFI